MKKHDNIISKQNWNCVTPLILIFYRASFDAGYRVRAHVKLKLFQAFF